MEDRLFEVLKREVIRQASFALMSASDLREALEHQDDTDRIWIAVQSFLVAAANVSKLLWGSGQSASNGRRALRESLGVSDKSVLRSRKMRNHFEHFDERLKKWAACSERHNIVDSNVMPANAISGIDSCDYLRNLDPNTWSLTFAGEIYELNPVLEALRKLLSGFGATKPDGPRT